ncbi:MAG: JAB domain-containing protein [Solirubrobacteraceae bacterium]
MNDQTMTTPKARTAQGGARRSPSRSPEAHQPAARVRSESAASYGASASSEAEREAGILEQAEAILRRRFERMATLASPHESGAWLRARLATRDSEAFCCVFMDNRHRVIAFEEMFQGTIDGASVHPREVVRACIKHNAAAVILCHNHPSGVSEPSGADVALTQTLKQALDLIGCRVLDHLVIGETVTSLSQRGLC